jgi:predicted trehalose synthase
MTKALAVLEVALSRAHQLRAASETALQRVQEEIIGALRAMTPAVPGDMPLPQLEIWLTRRGKR